MRDYQEMWPKFTALLFEIPACCYEKFKETGFTPESSDGDKLAVLVKLLGQYKGEAVEALPTGSSQWVFQDGPCPEMPVQGTGNKPWQDQQYLCYPPPASVPGKAQRKTKREPQEPTPYKDGNYMFGKLG